MVKEVDITLLNKSVRTLEASFKKFKINYDEKDSVNFNKMKKILIQAQKKILENTK